MPNMTHRKPGDTNPSIKPEKINTPESVNLFLCGGEKRKEDVHEGGKSSSVGVREGTTRGGCVDGKDLPSEYAASVRSRL